MEKPFDFHGKRWDLEGVWLNPKPLQKPHPPTFVVAAFTPRVMDRVARLGLDPELAHRLQDIQVATLVLRGTNDTSSPSETGRLYIERLPDGYYVLVYDAGHAVESERPEALFAAVRDFIEHRGAFIVEHKNMAINP